MKHQSGSPSRPAACRGAWRRGAAARAGLVVVLAAAVIAVGALAARSFLKGPAKADGSAGSAGSAPEAADRPMAALSEGSEAIRQMEYPRAEAVLSRAVQDFPGDQGLRLAYAQALMGLGRFADAYAQFEAAIAIGPATPAMHFDAGTVASKAGRPERAEEHYSMARAGDAAEPRYPLFLAMVQAKLGKETEATANLLHAVRLDPDLAEAWGTLAELAFSQNALNLAQQHLDKAIRLQPAVARWRVDQAKILKAQGEPERAATIILSLDETTRREKSVLRVLGQCYGLLGRAEDAAAEYEAAARVKPTDPELWYEAALWRERASDVEGAARCAKSAAMLGSVEAREMLERLGG